MGDRGNIMSQEAIEKKLSDFLTADSRQVISLKGTWGVGKTYMWNEFLKSFSKDEIKLGLYSYVSLFGISSLQELKSTIITNLEFLKDDSWITKDSAKTYAKKSFAKFFDTVKNAVPILKDTQFSSEYLLGSFIENIIICFDDFERLNSNSDIKPEEVLGFISQLKEERNCNVLLIFNEEKLEETKSVYDKYREKVIDIELELLPSIEDVVRIVFSKPSPYYKSVYTKCNQLNINNIRIIKKIKTYLDLIEPYTKTLNVKVMDYIIIDLLSVMACYYRINDKYPPITFLKNDKYSNISDKVLEEIANSIILNNYKQLEDEPVQTDEDIKRDQWNIFLNTNLSFYRDENYLNTIIDLVDKGYPDYKRFELHAKKLSDWLDEADKKDSFQSTIGEFYLFNLEKDDFISKTTQAFKRSVAVLTKNDLNLLYESFVALGEIKLANELTDLFCRTNIRIDNIQEFKEAYYSISKKDDELSKKINTYINCLTESASFPLEDCLKNLPDRLKNRFLSDITKKSLKSATVDDFYTIIKKYGLEASITYAIYGLISHKIIDPMVSENALNAFKKIASESEFNKLRIVYIFELQLDKLE